LNGWWSVHETFFIEFLALENPYMQNLGVVWGGAFSFDYVKKQKIFNITPMGIYWISTQISLEPGALPTCDPYILTQLTSGCRYMEVWLKSGAVHIRNFFHKLIIVKFDKTCSNLVNWILKTIVFLMTIL
jgi:hypothetical protein